MVVIRYHVCYIPVSESLSNAPLADLSLNLSTISFKEKHQRGCFNRDFRFTHMTFKETAPRYKLFALIITCKVGRDGRYLFFGCYICSTCFVIYSRCRSKHVMGEKLLHVADNAAAMWTAY